MNLLRQLVVIGTALSSLWLGGCTTVGVVMSAAGVATDSSVTWEIVKHVHGKLTEGDPIPCMQLNSVQRALNERCGDFEVGSLKVADVGNSGLQECPLAVAVRNPKFWPVVPELIAKGALPERCATSPLVELAQRQPCPAFETASPAVIESMRWLALGDARAIHHDSLRMLSCPNARTAGLATVLDTWQQQGDLNPGLLAFSPLDALHPDDLDSPLTVALEARGHSARNALGTYPGKLPSGFEEALRTSHWSALEWWLKRVPELANRVPPSHGGQVPWVPLARVLVPSFMPDQDAQEEMINFLMAHGADPWQRLPFQQNQTVAAYAKWMKSPHAALFELDLSNRPERLVSATRPGSAQ
jgi:hypothetical protein